MLNKKLASLHDEEPCICIRRKKQTQVREEYTHKPHNNITHVVTHVITHVPPSYSLLT